MMKKTDYNFVEKKGYLKMFFFHNHKYSLLKFLCLLTALYGAILLIPNKKSCKNISCFSQILAKLRLITKAKDSENYQYNEIYMGKFETTSTHPPIDSPVLIKYIKEYILIPPPPTHVSLRLEKPKVIYNAQIGQDRIVEKILNGKRNGFFVESGAQTGELLSNTLYLERFLNWTGLLVEPSKRHFKKLVHKKRKSYIANTCLSTRPYPIKIGFNGNQLFEPGTLLTNKKAIAELNCYPLFSILLAMEPPMLNIDYFSLDIDGPELQVLKSIPWNRVNISVISVEVRHNPFPLEEGTRDEIVKLITSQGYHYIKHVFDIIFIRNGTVYDINAINKIKSMG